MIAYETGEIDDRIVTNNGDSEKVLATVVSAVLSFLNRNPEAMIYATRSTKSRTRLYQIGITNHIEEVENFLEVYGELESGWERFKNNRQYLGFIVKLK